MKIRHFLLGAAIVALMASCGSKQATESTTESAAETVAEEVMTEQEPVAEEIAEEEEEAVPATPAKKDTKQTAKTTTATAKETKPAVDPCEAKVKAFEKYVDELKAAKKNKATGAEALKAYVDLKQKAESMEATIKDCTSNPDYKTRLTNAIVAEKQAR